MDLEKTVKTCYETYKIFEDVLNSYVSDYYLEEHWSKLPSSWQQYFIDIDMKQFSNLLDFDVPLEVTPKLLPLSVLCLRKLISNNVLPRTQIGKFDSKDIVDVPQFFWKNVKLKKKHEISIMAQACYNSAVETNCFNIVDIGSGLGHLSRLMSYQYGFKVCTFEADEALSSSAEELDRKLEKMLHKRGMNLGRKFDTTHINQMISAELGTYNFIKLVKNAFGYQHDMKFGLVGLHPCGDLGSTLLHLYKECPNIVFLNMASCCYMKLTLEPSAQAGFPLSSYCENMNIRLSYLSCEIACHAIENYVEKLKNPVDSSELKIHAYRAGLEQLLVNNDPQLRHSKICSAKYKEGLSFQAYVKKVTENLGVSLDDSIITDSEDMIEGTWEKVVAFYSLRLFLAPLVETIILLDRFLYLNECSSECDILPLFDCRISPRNQVLIARKINNS
ncbi:unnamed protein product [Phaedon cochleariae]|uniref:Methyltransferase domain-containing protein n=1 Tax=Phaedon cochleariae TaxID=80249 RepID=A0A9P0DM31_PHACE|nr:unnamed protein product [Phaedon cochleariae]